MGWVSYSNITALLTDLGTKLRKKPTVVRLTQAQYNALTSTQKHDTTKAYYITDATGSNSVEIDDTTTSANKVWSSQKTNNQIATKPSINDSSTSASAVWSSQKTSNEISNNAYTLPTAANATKGGVVVKDNRSLYMSGNDLSFRIFSEDIDIVSFFYSTSLPTKASVLTATIPLSTYPELENSIVQGMSLTVGTGASIDAVSSYGVYAWYKDNTDMKLQIRFFVEGSSSATVAHLYVQFIYFT